MASLSEIKMVFRKKFCLTAGIFLFMSLSDYRPPVNLKSNISDVSIPAEEKAKTNWIKGKISVLGALSPAIENNQSPELERLKWQSKRRKASFEKSLETMPSRKSQFLQKTAKGDNIKDNE